MRIREFREPLDNALREYESESLIVGEDETRLYKDAHARVTLWPSKRSRKNEVVLIVPIKFVVVIHAFAEKTCHRITMSIYDTVERLRKHVLLKCLDDNDDDFSLCLCSEQLWEHDNLYYGYVDTLRVGGEMSARRYVWCEDSYTHVRELFDAGWRSCVLRRRYFGPPKIYMNDSEFWERLFLYDKYELAIENAKLERTMMDVAVKEDDDMRRLFPKMRINGRKREYVIALSHSHMYFAWRKWMDRKTRWRKISRHTLVEERDHNSVFNYAILRIGDDERVKLSGPYLADFLNDLRHSESGVRYDDNGSRIHEIVKRIFGVSLDKLPSALVTAKEALVLKYEKELEMI